MDFTWRLLPISMKLSRIQKSTDQAFLARVAVEETDPTVREAAVDHITDIDILARVPFSSDDDDIVLHVVKRLSNPSDLTYVARVGKSEKARLAALAAINDQEVLIKIAREDTWLPIREAAVEKIEDQSILLELFQNNDSDFPGRYGVRRKAVECMTGQEELGWIAMHGNPAEKEIAYHRLSDERIIANALRYEYDVKYDNIALGKVEDPALREEVRVYYQLCRLLSRHQPNDVFLSQLYKTEYCAPYSPKEQRFLREHRKLIEEMAESCPNRAFKEIAHYFLEKCLHTIGLKGRKKA